MKLASKIQSFLRLPYTLVLAVALVPAFASAQSTTYTPLFDNSTFPRSIDVARPVDAIKGTASVTGSGTASYTIPIYCGPGTNGVLPSLSLSYNSAAGQGPLGQGWQLSGLSAITRAGWDMYHHNKVAAVAYKNKAPYYSPRSAYVFEECDAFVLDGQYLYPDAPAAGTYGRNGSSYHTENNNYAYISSLGAAGGSPEYFRVTAKDGTITEFGNTPDSRVLSDDKSVVMLWRMNKIQDINGNYISFTYDNSDQDSRIIQIRYTGNVNTGLLPYNEINFQYTLRSDKNTAWDRGFSLQSKYLLSQVQVKAEGTLYKTYQLNYGKSATGASFLKYVDEIAADGSKLNDTRFQYGLPAAMEYGPETSGTLMGAAPTDNTYIVTGDFDGDGLSDILLTETSPIADDVQNTQLTIKKKSATGNTYNPIYTYTFSSGSTTLGAMKFIRNAYASSSADFNGDGRDDIMLIQNNLTGGVRAIDWIKVYYARPDGTFNLAGPADYTCNAVGSFVRKGSRDQYNLNYMGDFDGDGSMDFITIMNDQLTVHSPRKGSAKLCSSLGAYTVGDLFTNADYVYVINADGDAKSDIMLVQESLTRIFTFNFEAELSELHLDQIGKDGGYPTRYHDIMLGDFNGDGRTDILTGPLKGQGQDTSVWMVGYFDGNYFQGKNLAFDHVVKQYPRYNPNNPKAPDVTDNIRIGDFNGDGKSDIYLYEYNGAYTGAFKHHIYYSTGTQFEHEVISTTNKARNLVSGDFNGDGKSDVLFYSKDFPALFHYFHPGEQSLLLQKVTDGFNRTSGFFYRPLSWSGDFYTKGSGDTYPLCNLQCPFYVVTAFSQPDGAGGATSTSYKYQNLLVHRAGRGMLGFEKMTTYHDASGLRIENTMGLDRDYYIPYPAFSKTFLNSTGELLSQTDNTISTSGWGDYLRPGAKSSFILRNTGSVQRDFRLGLTTTTANNSWDSYGNITANSTTVSGGPELFTNTVTTTYIATGTSAIPNRASEVSTTLQRGSKTPAGTKSVLSYYPNGLVKNARNLSTEAPSDYIDSYFEYDAYGNPVFTRKRTASSTAANEPTEAFEYDTKGRFVVNATNALGDKRYKSTHPFWAMPLSETGYNGLSASNTYDSWGKLKRSTVPTGPGFSYNIDYSDAWDISGLQLYYSLKQDPSAPDVQSWYDASGRAITTRAETFDGNWVTTRTTYDGKGNVSSDMLPYLPGETPIVTTYTYDELNRPASSSNFAGTTTYTYLQASGLTTNTTSFPDGKVKKITTDAQGKTLKSSNGMAGTVYSSYDSRGAEVKTEIGDESTPYLKMIEKTYDGNGRLISMGDQDAGTTTYTYDQFGQLRSQTDAKGITTNWTYDIMGRPLLKTAGAYTTNYSYYGKDKDYRLQQQSVSSSVDGTVTDYYEYATGGDITRQRKTLPAGTLEKTYTYDAYKRLLGNTNVNSGFKTRNTYDANGFLQQISTDMAGTPATILYQALKRNGRGQVTAFRRPDGRDAAVTYTDVYATNYSTPGLQDLEMSYDAANGNVLSREDRLRRNRETFEYDAIERLTKAQACHTGAGGTSCWPAQEMTYDSRIGFSMGQLVTKSDAGIYTYGYRPANAVKSINPGASTLISHETQDISYTDFDKAHRITEQAGGINYEEQFIYDAAEDRVYSQQLQNGKQFRERVYMGDYEWNRDAGTGAIQQLHYISGDEGLCGLAVKEGGNFRYYSLYTDHLGCIVTVSDESGTAVAQQNFDAWGRERNADTWEDNAAHLPAKPAWLYRGYTGHEMLPVYGLINMNGRMYDPANGRMLRPDNFVTYPGNTQSYNRYSYALNNPLTYIDPDGNHPVLVAAVIGMALGAWSGGMSANLGEINPFKWDYSSNRTWGYMLAGAAVGGASAAAGTAVATSGSMFANTTGIMAGSLTNSLGTAMYTEGQSSISMSFGAASYDFTRGEFGYLGKKGNSFMKNLGYGFGALANVSDFLAGFKPGEVQLNTEKSDAIGHSALTKVGETDLYNSLVSVGPDPGGSWIFNPFKFKNGTNNWNNYVDAGNDVWKINIKGVNVQRISSYGRNLNQGVNYNLYFSSCVNHTARALTLAGAPSIGLHPFILHTQMYLRSIGVRPMLFSSYFHQY